MKYSLRNLMLLVTLACVALGARIEYVRRMAVFHESKAASADSGMGTAYHRRAAKEYRKAILQPWMVVNESSLKMNPLPELLIMTVLAGVALVLWLDHRRLSLPNSSAPAPNSSKNYKN